MGRFHYWLGTSQVTIFGLVLHRPPFDTPVGFRVAISSHIIFSNKIIPYRTGSVKYLILSGVYYGQDVCTTECSTFVRLIERPGCVFRLIDTDSSTSSCERTKCRGEPSGSPAFNRMRITTWSVFKKELQTSPLLR